MILYEKKFRLGNGISFSRYIKSLDEMNFSPYTLLINETPDTKDFHIEVVITNPVNLWGWHNVFSGGVLISEYKVRHARGEKFFIIQGSAGTGNYVVMVFYIAISLFGFLAGFLPIFTKGDTFSLGNFVLFTMLCCLPLVPIVSTYSRERRLLDRIGVIASELKRK